MESGLIGVVGVACTAAAEQPGLELLVRAEDGSIHDVMPPNPLVPGPLAQLPPAQGTGPATRPLSYRQLKPSHGPRFHG